MSYCELFCVSLARFVWFFSFLRKPENSLLFTAKFKKQLLGGLVLSLSFLKKEKSVCLRFSQSNILEAEQIERLSMKNAVYFVLPCLSVFSRSLSSSFLCP